MESVQQYNALLQCHNIHIKAYHKQGSEVQNDFRFQEMIYRYGMFIFLWGLLVYKSSLYQ